MDIIYDESGKIRLDKWLAYRFPEKSREFFNENIKNGNITINKKIVKPSWIIRVGEEISFNDDIFTEPEKMEVLPNKNVKFDIVFENSDFMIIEKPAGLLVHPTLKNENDTLVNGLIAIRPEIKLVGDDSIRPGIVHRLDKDTSGLMIIAKNQLTFEKLKEKFQKHQMHKTYTALVFGKLKDTHGIIDRPILRSGSKFNRRKIGIEPNDGKEAITEYETIKDYGKVSLVKAFPKTGRTHQIRVHFASMSNYVIGDNEYGSDKINKEYGLNRQFLHASELEFSFKSKKYHFKSELPLDLKAVLEKL